MPFTGDDLLFMQSGIIEALKGLAEAFAGGENAILSGVEAITSPGDWILSEGFVYLNGEICYFPGDTVTGAGQDPSKYGLTVKDSYDPDGNEVFADSQSKDTYLVRKAEVITYTSPPYYNSMTDILFTDIESRRVGAEVKISPVTYNTSNGNNGNIQCLRMFGRVFIAGKLTAGRVYGTDHIFEIPAGFRPSTAHQFICARGHTYPSNTTDEFVSNLINFQVIPSNGRVYGDGLGAQDIGGNGGPVTVFFHYYI